MEYLNSIYEKLLVITPGSDAFSLQILLLSLYIIALLYSMNRAYQNQERVTDFISTATVTIKYTVTATIVEKVLEMMRLDTLPSFIQVQNLYLYLFMINIVFIILLKKAHIQLSFVYGDLYNLVKRVFLWHGFLHLAIWLKLTVFEIRPNQYGSDFIDMTYSFLVIYFNITLFIGMIKPSILKNNIINQVLAPSINRVKL